MNEFSGCVVSCNVIYNALDEFSKILQISDACQQRFSSECEPALHLALPALEDLHAAWSSLLDNKKYKHFEPGLQAGIDKIAEYYDKTGNNDAYVLSISEYLLVYIQMAN